MSARASSTLPSAPVRFASEAAFIVLVGVVAAVLDLGALAIVLVMGVAWVVVVLVERAAKSTRPRGAIRPGPLEPATGDVSERTQPERLGFSAPRENADPESVSAGEWNLWELERRAREHAGADAVPEEWAAIFMSLREYAKSDGALPPQFDSLVRESFPELTRVA